MFIFTRRGKKCHDVKRKNLYRPGTVTVKVRKMAPHFRRGNSKTRYFKILTKFFLCIFLKMLRQQFTVWNFIFVCCKIREILWKMMKNRPGTVTLPVQYISNTFKAFVYLVCWIIMEVLRADYPLVLSITLEFEKKNPKFKIPKAISIKSKCWSKMDFLTDL